MLRGCNSRVFPDRRRSSFNSAKSRVFLKKKKKKKKKAALYIKNNLLDSWKFNEKKNKKTKNIRKSFK